VVVTVSLRLYFKAEGWGKERSLYPPFDWYRITQGVGASFKLVSLN
jgi:hypothetical protein